MKKILLPFALAVAMVAGVAQATTVDLTTFTSTVGTNSAIAVTQNMGGLMGTTTLTGSVVGLESFQWNFMAGDPFVDVIDDYSYVRTSTGQVQLADIGAVGDFGTSGWQTFTFNPGYSGVITFGVANVGDDNDASALLIRNVEATGVLATVPEPETYAMLLAGLGLVGTVVVRRKRRFATT